MSLFCEFGFLTTRCTAHALLNDAYCRGFSGARWEANKQVKNPNVYMVCLRKSDSSQGLCVMRLDIGTINSLWLDDGVRKILLM